jgi:hypothetical protein
MWRAIGVPPVRYKHHLHTKIKGIAVTGLGDLYVSCEVRTSSKKK